MAHGLGYTGQSNTWSSLLGGKNGLNTDQLDVLVPQGYVDALYMDPRRGMPMTGAMAGTFTYQL